MTAIRHIRAHIQSCGSQESRLLYSWTNGNYRNFWAVNTESRAYICFMGSLTLWCPFRAFLWQQGMKQQQKYMYIWFIREDALLFVLGFTLLYFFFFCRLLHAATGEMRFAPLSMRRVSFEIRTWEFGQPVPVAGVAAAMKGEGWTPLWSQRDRTTLSLTHQYETTK